MILSALLTSVGINLGLCLLFFTLYSILRKQPSYAIVYKPRWVKGERSQQENHFDIERLLPTPGWVKRAWQLSEDELLSISGLDGVVFMRIFVFSLKVFAFAVVIGVFILVPVNYSGNQLSFSELSNTTLDSFSISNVDNGSNRLWIHFCAIYVFTAFVCYLLLSEYKYVSSKRIACYYASKPQPNQFTVIVTSIPASPSGSFSESIDRFFTEYHPSTYLSHAVIRRTNRLRGLISDADKLSRRLLHLKSSNKGDHLDQHEKKLQDLEDNVRLEQSSLLGKEVPAAFVSFKSRYGAAEARHIQQGINPTQWVTEPAPEPQDVYWPFFSASFLRRWISKVVVISACIVLTVLFLIPVVLVQGLTHLEQLETYLPFLQRILKMEVVADLVTGYLPSLILQMFLSFVPPIMIMLSSIQGYISLSLIVKSACVKMLWFTIWNIFFANVLSGSALYLVNIILEIKKIPWVLAEAVPAQATFFIAYVVTSGWTSTSSELFRLFPLIANSVKMIFRRKVDDDFEAPSVPYHSEIPRIVFFGLIGVTYFFLAPLILPFILVYYCLGYIVYRNQLLNVYAPKFDTGGTFWPIIYDSTIFSLLLMHTIAIGTFGLKKLPLASSLSVPPLVLTLLFNDYCRKRFLPIFKAYPAECLINKDRSDQNDPAMGEFLDKLVTAYQDPALMPIQYSQSSSDRRNPLLNTSEV